MAEFVSDSTNWKPCPFCRSPEVSMSFSATLQSSEPAHRFIECEDCAACGASVKIVDGDDDAAKAAAIAAWNTRPGSLTQNVVSLVIAAREAFDTGMLPDDERDELDKALERFSAAVPYENEPDARAAPPAMDREAVGKVAEQLSRETKDWRHNAYTRVLLTQMHDRLSATLSADAIRQGGGATTANSPVVPDGWKLVPIEPTRDMIRAGMIPRFNLAQQAERIWRDMLAATPASHASDGGEA